MQITPDQKKRLLYAKHLLGRAVELQSKRSELLVAESVLTLHDASEMVMQVVYEHHQIKPTPNFVDFWSLLPKANLKEPPFFSRMRVLNDLRVGFKHRGTIPNARTVLALDPDVRAFCTSVCLEYLDVQLNELTLGDLIEPADVREHVKNAEIAYSSGDVGEALVQIAEAFHDVWTFAEENGCIFTHDIPIGGKRVAPNAIATWEPGLIKYLNIVLLGIDLPTYSFFMDFMPHISRGFDDSIQVQLSGEPKATEEQFAALVSFVVDLALSVQHRIREPLI